jgi:hypothetical protein
MYDYVDFWLLESSWFQIVRIQFFSNFLTFVLCLQDSEVIFFDCNTLAVCAVSSSILAGVFYSSFFVFLLSTSRMSIWRFLDSKFIVSVIWNPYWYAPHSRTIQHQAPVLKELDSLPPDAFRGEIRAELSASLISFYEGVLKVPGAGRRPEAKIIKRRFAVQRADDPPGSESWRIHWRGGGGAAEAAQPAKNLPAGKQAGPSRGRGGSSKGAKSWINL